MSKLLSKYKATPVQAKAALWFLVCSFLQKGISFITTPIFTRLLTDAEYGRYGTFNSWYGIVSIVIALSLSAGVHNQGLVKFEEERAKFSSSLQGLSFTLISGWTVIYLLFHDFWNSLLKIPTVQMLAMLIMIWASAAFNFWANEQRVKYKYRALVAITLVVSLVKPVLGIYLVTHSEDKVTARILGLLLVDVIAYTGLFLVQMKRGKAFFSAKYWKHALAFSLPLVPHYLSQTVLNSSDVIMIRNMVGEAESGIYALAYSISYIMTIFNTALIQTVGPWMYQKLKARKIGDLAPIAYITLALIGAVNLLLMLFAPEAVAFFGTGSYRDGIWIVPPVAMSVFFMYSYDLFATFSFYHEKKGYIMTASILGAALNIVLNAVFIRKFGYVAAGYTTLVCFMMYAAGHYFFMRKVCRQHYDGKYPYQTGKLLAITVPFMAAGFGILATYRFPYVRYGVAAVVLIVVLIMHRKIIAAVKRIMSLRKKGAEE